MHNLRRRSGRRRLVPVAVLGLVAASSLFFQATPAGAASCTSVGGIEVDGNLDAGTCGGLDWASGGLGVQSTSSTGTYKVVGDNTDPATWKDGGGTPPKVDFTTVYSFAEVVGGHYFAYVGWERDQNSGTGGYAIEIDNAGTRVSDGVPQPDRSAGGFVFYITTKGGAAPALGQSCAFTSQATYPGTCSTGQTGYTAAINAAQVHDPLAGIDVPQGEFLEIGLDVTTLTGIAPACPAPPEASLYMRSFTGEDAGPTGNLKGFVAPFAIAPNSTCVAPGLATAADPGLADLVAPGDSVADVAALTAVGDRPTPTGTVAFFLCGPAVSATACSSGGLSAGEGTVQQNGTATSPPVDGDADSGPGYYCWRAEYTPDTDGAKHYLPTTHSNDSTECFRVQQATPTISTLIALSGTNAPGLGLTEISDTAILSGFVAGTVTGETITFRLYGPFAAGDAFTCGEGNNVFTTTGALSGGGVATTSDLYSPTAAGTYVWVASYGGDAFNTKVADTCGVETEKATIVAAVVDVSKSANPAGAVSSGDTIGFDITVTNGGSVPSLGTVVSDPLPAGAGKDLDWTLSPPYEGCAISGEVGSQVLTCRLGTVPGLGSLPVIHVQSPTTAGDCGTVENKASVTTTNGAGGDSDIATVAINCAAVTLTKTADAAVVNAGDQIGFTVTAANGSAAGTGTAHGVGIDDPLPGGTGIDWHLESGPATCTVTGVAPVQRLTCSPIDLAGGGSEAAHVVSATSFAACGTYVNTATATVGNGATPPAATASVDVQCSALALTKTADAATVRAGQAIGFTLTATNAGPGTADDVTLADPLPAGEGVRWSLDGDGTSTPDCAVVLDAGAQALTCAFGDLAPGAVVTVHLVSATTSASCADYPNTAQLGAANAPAVTATASTTVASCLGVEAEPPVSKPPAQKPETSPLAVTGAAHLSGQLKWALALLLIGGLMLLATRGREQEEER